MLASLLGALFAIGQIPPAKSPQFRIEVELLTWHVHSPPTSPDSSPIPTDARRATLLSIPAVGDKPFNGVVKSYGWKLSADGNIDSKASELTITAKFKWINQLYPASFFTGIDLTLDRWSPIGLYHIETTADDETCYEGNVIRVRLTKKPSFHTLNPGPGARKASSLQGASGNP